MGLMLNNTNYLAPQIYEPQVTMTDEAVKKCKGLERKEWIERQNLEIRDVPEVRRFTGSRDELTGSRELLRVPCTSLSTLTGLSLGSRVTRPCQAIKTVSTGRGGSTRRTSPSSFLLHGYDWISAEDQRILSIMAMRREAKMEEEDILISARNLWEKDKILYNQMLNEKKKQWNEMVQDKRRFEKMERERRKENNEHMHQLHLSQLEEKINERHSKCEKRHDQILYQKKLPRGDVDADTQAHRLRREMQDEEQHTRSSLHLNEIQAKERRVQENLSAILCYREKNIKERRCRRERKMEAARQLRDALNERFDEWCEENKKLLHNRLCLCEYRAMKNVDWRRRSTQERNQMKRLQHSHMIALVKEEDKNRELRTRQEIIKKEVKICNTISRKEHEKLRLRMNALTTASLRQKIKNSYHLTG